EKSLRIVTAYVQDMDQPRVRARHRHKLLNAFELPFVRHITRECFSLHNFDCMKGTDRVPRQPDLTISTLANATNECVIRDRKTAFLSSRRLCCFCKTRGLDECAFEHFLLKFQSMEVTSQRPAEG